MVMNKMFTLAEANAMLPLLRVVIRDVRRVAGEIRKTHAELLQSRDNIDEFQAADDYFTRMEKLSDQLEHLQSTMDEYEEELFALGVQLRCHDSGIVDFPALLNGEEVFFSWQPEDALVCHWHSRDLLDRTRQKLSVESNLTV